MPDQLPDGPSEAVEAVAAGSPTPPASGLPALTDVSAHEAVRRRLESSLLRLAPGTRRAYNLGLRRFAEFAGPPVEMTGAKWWDVMLAVAARGRVFTGDMADRFAESAASLAPATIAQRISAVRWALAVLFDAGIIEWTVRIRSPRVTAYRDTRGPGLEAVQALFAAADRQPGLLGLRDGALVRALFVLGLRRGEVTSLRLCDWDASERTLAILGKGRRDRELISVAPELAGRLDTYRAARVELAPDQPLFVTHGPCSRDRRLEGDAIRRTLSRLSGLAGLPNDVRPHGMRHAAITNALDLFQGDVRRVARFSRHSKVETVLLYDDRRRDLASEIARGLEGLAIVVPTSPCQ